MEDLIIYNHLIAYSFAAGFFPIRLKVLRENKKLNQGALAELFKVNQRTVSTWENGKAQPSIKILIAMAEYFEVDLNYLLCLDQETFECLTKIIQTSNGVVHSSVIDYCEQIVSEIKYSGFPIYNPKISVLETEIIEKHGMPIIRFKRKSPSIQ